MEGGTSRGGAVLYIYGDPVWRSLEAGGRAEGGAEGEAGKKKLVWESVCQTGYYCVSVSTNLIGSGVCMVSQN